MRSPRSSKQRRSIAPCSATSPPRCCAAWPPFKRCRGLTMQLRADQLSAQLAKGLRPLYTVYGDEPLLAQEATDAIRAAARAAGHTERQVHTVSGAHFDWSGLLGASQAMSLFADKQLIEIRIP